MNWVLNLLFLIQIKKQGRVSHLIDQKKYPVYVFKTETSGEKLYEEFYTDSEIFDLDKFNALGVISKKTTYSSSQFSPIFEELYNLLEKKNLEKSDIVTWLKKYIPEFEHIETGISLDKKM
jgi:hypothetical protein